MAAELAMLLVRSVLLLLIVSEYSSSVDTIISPPTKTYCILTNESATTCNCEECYLLANLDPQKILNGSILTFNPGTHYLNRSLTFKDLRDIKIIGREDPIIDCISEDSGLVFFNVDNLCIGKLRFRSCGVLRSYLLHKNKDHKFKSTLIFQDGRELFLSDLTVQGPLVAGIAIFDVSGHIGIDSSTFSNASIKGEEFISGNFIGYNFCHVQATIEITNSRFINNNFAYKFDRCLSAGLSIVLRCDNLEIILKNVTLKGNGGYQGGNIGLMFLNPHQYHNTSVTIDNNSLIEGGLGRDGGGMFVTVHGPNHMDNYTRHLSMSPPLLMIRNSTFRGNRAFHVGGAMYLRYQETLHAQSHDSPSIIIEHCHFESNHLINGIGGLALHYTTLVVRGYKKHYRPQIKVHIFYCSFSNHRSSSSIIPRVGDSVIFIKTSPYCEVHSVNISENTCTGLMALASNVMISGEVNIFSNTAYSGGGILLCSSAVLYLKKDTTLSICNNTAEHTGGGINIETECILNVPKCFFQLTSELGENNSLLENVHVHVKDNRAKYSGHNLFGGSIERCYLIDMHGESSDIFKKIFKITENGPHSLSSIASLPKQVCLYNQSNKTISCTKHKEKVYPGQTIKVKVVVVGQKLGVVPGTVHAKLNVSYDQYRINIDKNHVIQQINKAKSQKLSYRIYSQRTNVTVELYLAVEEIGINPYTKKLKIELDIKDCPLGYTLVIRSSQTRCNCDILKKHVHHQKDKMRCSISRQVGITFYPPIWIGVVVLNHLSVAISSMCPRDYCSSSKQFLNLANVTLADVNSSVQCSYNRGGILCGGCRDDNFSLILGSSECWQSCTNFSLFLLVVFVLVGIFLIFFITSLNLTISRGTINGLIFYANIIHLYGFFLFKNNDELFASFLKVFIAWLNLDFGIRSCFFRGMDSFSKALLQFVFPIYMWLIAGSIILLSSKFQFVAKLVGRKSVNVLATLLLLSFSKIIRAAMDALHFTLIYSTDNTNPLQKYQRSIRWTMDGNLRYMQGRHIALFIVGAIFAIITLPFMATLLCIHQLQKLPNRRLFFWIHRLKPFFDSYTGPLTDSGRFWPGLLLLARIFILAIYSFNFINSDIIIMASTVFVCVLLLFVAMLLPRGVYRNHKLNIVEYFFITNLAFLFLGLICAVYYDKHMGRVYVANLSIGVAFLYFVLLVTCCILGKLTCTSTLRRYWQRRMNTVRSCNEGLDNRIRAMDFPPYVNFNEEREPLLSNVDLKGSN